MDSIIIKDSYMTPFIVKFNGQVIHLGVNYADYSIYISKISLEEIVGKNISYPYSIESYFPKNSIISCLNSLSSNDTQTFARVYPILTWVQAITRIGHVVHFPSINYSISTTVADFFTGQEVIDKYEPSFVKKMKPEQTTITPIPIKVFYKPVSPKTARLSQLEKPEFQFIPVIFPFNI